MLEQKELFKPKRLFLILIVIVLFVACLMIGSNLRQEINISYVSQSELLELEKTRLGKVATNNKQLFFGKPEEAVKLIEQIQNERTKGNNIVLLSQNAIYGKKVKSISKEVHEYLLERLK